MKMNNAEMNEKMMEQVNGGIWTDEAREYYNALGYMTATEHEDYLWRKYHDEYIARSESSETFDLEFMKAMLKRGYLSYD